MKELEQRANFRVKKVPITGDRDLPLVMFEDHRSTLIALYHARQSGLIDGENPPDLVRFDYHDDGKAP